VGEFNTLQIVKPTYKCEIKSRCFSETPQNIVHPHI